MPNSVYDVIIVGAGTMGMPTGAYLAKHGARTLLIDAFDPPHQSGSHHGETRMIRHAYGEGKQYVTLVKHAQALWESLEQQIGIKVFEPTGVLGLGPRESLFLQEVIDASTKYDLPLQRMTANEIRRQWPCIQVPEEFIGCLETGSGLIYSEKAIEAYKELALTRGAELLTGKPVLDIITHQGHVEVKTKDNIFFAEKVVVTAGAWAGKVLDGLALPIQPLRKVVGWFKPQSHGFQSPDLPSFYFDMGDRMFYGIPSLGESGLKLGRTDGGQPIDPDRHTQNFGAFEEDESDLRQFLKTYMPKANGQLLKSFTCLYTKSQDGHFIIDHHPLNDRIILACGFSGHGFKFASVMGEILGEMALWGQSNHDVSLFSLDRFVKGFI